MFPRRLLKRLYFLDFINLYTYLVKKIFEVEFYNMLVFLMNCNSKSSFFFKVTFSYLFYPFFFCYRKEIKKKRSIKTWKENKISKEKWS